MLKRGIASCSFELSFQESHIGRASVTFENSRDTPHISITILLQKCASSWLEVVKNTTQKEAYTSHVYHDAFAEVSGSGSLGHSHFVSPHLSALEAAIWRISAPLLVRFQAGKSIPGHFGGDGVFTIATILKGFIGVIQGVVAGLL